MPQPPGYQAPLEPGQTPGQAPFAPDWHDARHLWLKAGLLALWALVSFVASYFARALQFGVDGWSFSYWLTSQGAVLIFIAIVWVYCWAMNHFERQDAQRQVAQAAGDAAQGRHPDA